MSYLKKIEYEIVPEESFTVLRNCAGCGKKTHFINTQKFRVNANGNKLDVWLIYQCEKCKHTFNLTIYERQKSALVPTEEYKGFLDNDELLAEKYGRNLQFFKRNKAEVDFQNVNFRIEKREEKMGESENMQQVLIVIHNPYCLKLRPEKQIAEILGLSKSQVKKHLEKEEIRVDAVSSQYLSVYVGYDLQRHPY